MRGHASVIYLKRHVSDVRAERGHVFARTEDARVPHEVGLLLLQGCKFLCNASLLLGVLGESGLEVGDALLKALDLYGAQLRNEATAERDTFRWGQRGIPFLRHIFFKTVAHTPSSLATSLMGRWK